MSNISKRVLALLMALVMVLSNVSGIAQTAYAAESVETEPVVVVETEAAVVETTAAPVVETTEAPVVETTEEIVVETTEEVAEATEEVAVETTEAIETEATEDTVVEETEETIFEFEVETEVANAAAANAELDTKINGLAGNYTLASATKPGTVTWSAELDDANGAVTINGSVVGYTPNGKAYAAETTQLTLTNNSDVEAVLTFDYEITIAVAGKDSLSIAGTNYSAGAGAYELTMAAGDTVVIALKAAVRSGAANGASIKMTNVRLGANPTVETTFLVAQNGSYSVSYKESSVEIAEETKIQNTATTNYILTAIPAEGYSFAGWYNQTKGTYIGAGATSNNIRFDEPCSIVPLFVKTEDAIYAVGEARFTDLTTAATYAKNATDKVVVLLQNATLESGNYFIPKGVTFLIPFDDANTLYTDKPGCTSSKDNNVAWVQPYAYRTLNMADGAKLTLEGTMSVAAMHAAGGAQTAGSPTGPYGHVVMNSSSEIVVNNGGKLYVWGYITGSGNITANDGAEVYENLQVTDFRGGSASASLVPTGDDDPNLAKKKVFPFSQYYVQNIEVSLKLHHGAKESVYTSIYALDDVNSVMIDFIGTTASMFYIGEGSYVVKDYDPAADRLTLTAGGNGTVSVNGLSLTLAGVTVSSSLFNLPITNNITININSGSATIDQDAALLPGSQVNIAYGASLTVTTDHNVFVYDATEWALGNFVHDNVKVRPVSYSPSGKGSRSVDVDAKVDVNGTLYLDGYLYTTESGANISSSNGTGMIWLYSGAGDKTFTNQVTQRGTDTTFVDIPVTSAKLKNADASFTETADAVGGSGYGWSKAEGKWLDYVTVSFDSNGAEKEVTPETITYETIYWAILFEDPTMASVTLPEAPEYTNAEFIEWNTAADGTGTGYQPGDAYTVTGNVTLYAIWEVQAVPVKVTFNGTNVTSDGTAELNSGEAYTANLTAAEGYNLPESVTVKVGENTITNFTYENGKLTIPAEEVTADITITAVSVIKTYTVTWVDAKDTVTQNNVSHGTVIDTAETADEKTYDATNHYTFSYWEDAEGNKLTEGTTKVTGDVTFTAVYTAEAHNYAKEVDGTRVDATCKETGSVTMACSCGATTVKTLEIDKTNHASDEVTKVYKDSEYHTVTHTCCGAEEAVEHDRDTCMEKDCSCGGVYLLLVSENFDDIEVITITNGDAVPNFPIIDPSKPVYIKAKNKVGSGIMLTSYDLGLVSVTGELEIPADKIPSNTGLEVYIAATVNVTIQLNGGSIPEAMKAQMLAMGFTVTDSAFVYPAEYNIKQWCLIEELVAYDGHSIESVTDKAGKNYYVVDEEKPATIVLSNPTEDLELTINWTCDTLTDVAEVPATCGADGVKAHKVCDCSKAYDADGNEIADLEAWKKADGKIDATGEHVDGDDDNHDCDNCSATNVDNGCYGGTAYCNAKPICAECGQEYGETDPSNHASDDVTYTNNGDTHSATYDCCKAPYVTSESHTYVNGICVCEAVQTFTVTFDGNGANFYIYADRNYVDTLPVTVNYGGTAEIIGVGETDADGNNVWGISNGLKVLSGWNTKADGTGDHYAIGAKINPTGDMTLYAIWKEVAVGGVGLNSGEYLDLNGNVTTTQPQGGYAYYENGILTLNNYSYTGEGYMHQVKPAMTAAVYGRYQDLTIVLVGENRLKNTSSMGYDSAVYAVNLTILGEGTLTGEASGYGLRAATSIVIQGGDLNLTASWAISSPGTVTVSGGTVTGNGQGCAEKGWTFENNITILEPLGGKIAENGYLCDAKGYIKKSFKLARAYTVTFLDKDGEQIGEAQTVEQGKSATAPEAPEVTGYTFTNWDTDFAKVTSDLTVQAVYKVNEYTLTIEAVDFSNGDMTATNNPVEIRVPYGAKLADYIPEDCGEGYGNAPIYAVGDTITVDGTVFKGVFTINGWNSWNEEEGYVAIDIAAATMPAGEYTITHAVSFTGWEYTDEGTAYLIDNSRVRDTIYHVDGEAYLFGEDGYIVAGSGLVRHVTEDGTVEYYYFCPGNCVNGCTEASYTAFRNTATSEEDTSAAIHWVSKHNDLLPEWDYAFDARGVILHNEDTSLNGLVDEGEDTIYYIDGVPAYMGLIKIGEDYYYVRSSGKLIKNASYWISKTNGLLEEKAYMFDETGKLVPEQLVVKNGIVEENGGLYYYVDGVLTYAGLIEIEGNYYYVRSNGQLAQNQKYWVTKHNDLLPEDSYTFDENGMIVFTPEQDKANGIVDGYYYVDGVKTYAGLIEIEGAYYYINSSCQVITGRNYWITKTNGLLEEGAYTFDETGKIVFDQPEETLNGIVDGYYYVDGVKTYAGLVEIDGKYYYINSSCQVITGRKYWISKTNGLVEEGAYTFDETGAMVIG